MIKTRITDFLSYEEKEEEEKIYEELKRKGEEFYDKYKRVKGETIL